MKIDSSVGQGYEMQTSAANSGSNTPSQSGEVKASTLENQGNAVSISKQDIYEYAKLNPEYRPSIAEKTVIDAIERANRKLMGIQAEFQFSIHEQTKQIMVKVINKETKEVVREIPPEKTLDMVARMWELAGIIVDEKR